MPVTAVLGPEPKSHPELESANSLEDLLKRSCPNTYTQGETRVVASGLSGDFGTTIYPSTSSFVRSAIEAWGRHSHLVLRPDDVWFTILVQMSFFMKKNAESLRHLFVNFLGKEYIEVWANTYNEVIYEFRDRLQRKLEAPWVSEWIKPGFSTSTIDDEMTATVLMMGMMKRYFDYGGGEICGVPSITLLGTKQDWQRLIQKVDRIDDFGEEPKSYARRMRPILSRIVQTFDQPESTETKDFWNQMVQAKAMHSHLCGQPPNQYVVSGWILGFFFWDSTGSENRRFSRGIPIHDLKDYDELVLDGVKYGGAPLDLLPIGYAKANFKMINCHKGKDQSKPWEGWILAGSIGKSITSGAPAGYEAAVARQQLKTTQDTLRRNVSRSDDNIIRTQDADYRPSCLTGLFSSLNCFGKKATAQIPASPKDSSPTISEKGQTPSTEGHSTMQPMSGWFLFGPAKDAGPFVYDEEIDGPTVDAIMDCGTVPECQYDVSCTRVLKAVK